MTLITQLRKQFIIIIMGVFSGLVLLLFLLSIVAFRVNQIRFQNRIMNNIVQNNGYVDSGFLSMLPPDLRSIRYAYAQVSMLNPDAENTRKLFWREEITPIPLSEQFERPFLNNETGLDREHITSLFVQILENQSFSGTVENFCFLKKKDGALLMLVILDISALRSTLNTLVKHNSILVAISLFIIYWVSSILSGRAVKPAQEALDKQKQFISDASHEIKTPLAIILAQISALELELSSVNTSTDTTDVTAANRWITNIKSEIKRLSVLTQNLLTLARLESMDVQTVLKPLDYSTLIQSILLSYETHAYECGKRFSFDIEPGIRITANSPQLEQLVIILLDNALKYSNPGGIIEVYLVKKAHKAVLSVYNTGEGVREQEKKHIFERFYRSDCSRSRDTDGFGLGLSIAGEIAARHKIKIDIQGESGKWVCFSFAFPLLP